MQYCRLIRLENAHRRFEPAADVQLMRQGALLNPMTSPRRHHYKAVSLLSTCNTVAPCSRHNVWAKHGLGNVDNGANARLSALLNSRNSVALDALISEAPVLGAVN